MRKLTRAVAISAAFQMRNSMSRAMMQFVVLVQPLILATITHFMYSHSGIRGHSGYVVVGTSVATLWMITLWSSATDVNRERSMGTLPFLLMSPTPFPVVLAGKVLGNTMLGALSILLTSAYSVLILGIRISIASLTSLVTALFFTVASFVAFASVLALVFTLSREANMIANGLNYPVWLISGLLFPIKTLPIPVRLLGLAMPMAWAREVLEWAVYGDLSPDLLTGSFWAALAGLFVVALVYSGAVFFLYNRVVERRIRYSGQTEAM